MPLENIKEKYYSLLKNYFNLQDEMFLFKAAELGRELVSKDIPVEEIAELHQYATQRLGAEFPETKLLETAQLITAPLLEMLMSYGLAFRELLEERKRAEEALRTSEIRSRTLLEGSPVCNKIIDLDSRLQYMSAAGIKQLKIPDIKSFYGCTYPPDFFPESTRTSLIEHLERAKAGEISSVECPALDIEGSVVWYHTTFMPARDDEGQIKYIIATSVDITESKQVEAALKESDEKFRSLIESAPDGIIISDQSGYITLWNKGAQNIFGYQEDDIIGKPVTELMPETYRQRHRESMRCLVKTGTGKHIGKTLELEGIRKAGSTFPLELSMSTWQTREKRFFAAIIRDITKRKQTEENLKRSYETQQVLNSLLQISLDDKPLEDILGHALDIILSAPFMHLSPKGGILLVESGILRLKVCKNLPVVVQNMCDSVAFDHCLCGRAAESREIQFADCIDERHENRYQGITPHGHYNVPILHGDEVLGVIVLYLAHGHVSSEHEMRFLQAVANTMAGFIERRRAEEEKTKLEEQLRRSQKLETIGTLAGGIAHDFNNILMPIMGYADMALSELPSGSSLCDDLEHILTGANRAKELVEQILLFSRQLEKERQPLNLHLVVKEALKLLRPSIPTTVEIRQLIDASCDKVLADAAQMHQVVVNLCTNAWQAMAENGGTLTIELKQVELGAATAILHPNLRETDYVRLTVSDTGTGMDDKTLDRIFEPFFTTKAVDKGTGMGLSVVHGIVRSHHGEILVDSEPEKGTVVHVYLPTVKACVGSATKELEEITGGQESVLVVDDDKAVANVIMRMLKQLGYKAIVFHSSIEALKNFRQQSDEYDLVISDLTMPNMTGLELSKQLHKVRAEIPVLIMTGYGDNLDEDTCETHGIKQVIGKPMTKRDFAAAIREVLDR